MKKKDNRDQMLAYIREHPHAHSVDIASLFGYHPTTVAQYKRQLGHRTLRRWDAHSMAQYLRDYKSLPSEQMMQKYNLKNPHVVEKTFYHLRQCMLRKERSQHIINSLKSIIR